MLVVGVAVASRCRFAGPALTFGHNHEFALGRIQELPRPGVKAVEKKA